jgi:hypothetical protein
MSPSERYGSVPGRRTIAAGSTLPLSSRRTSPSWIDRAGHFFLKKIISNEFQNEFYLDDGDRGRAILSRA